MAASESSAAKPSTAGLAEGREVDPHAHQHEEDRHQEAGDRVDQLLDRVLGPLAEVPVVDAVEDQPGGEGADDGGEADAVGQVGEQEADGERQREQHPLHPQEARQPEDPAGEPAADQDRADQEGDRLGDDDEGVQASRVPPVLAAPMMPETTERITRPSTSSITAAPRMILDSRADELAEVGQHARRDADAGGAPGWRR